MYGHSLGEQVINIGLIGCDGRGLGALFEALKASPSVRVVAIADAFRDKAKKAFYYIKRKF